MWTPFRIQQPISTAYHIRPTDLSIRGGQGTFLIRQHTRITFVTATTLTPFLTQPLIGIAFHDLFRTRRLTLIESDTEITRTSFPTRPLTGIVANAK